MTERKVHEKRGVAGEDFHPPLVMLTPPNGLERMESGPVQFGDDWPGVFVRGDNALHMAMLMAEAVDALRKYGDDQLSATQLEGYAKLFSSCSTV